MVWSDFLLPRNAASGRATVCSRSVHDDYEFRRQATESLGGLVVETVLPAVTAQHDATDADERPPASEWATTCLLYTSDAADE